MNFYVVVEGFMEKAIYPKWINQINPNLKAVNYLEDMTENSFIVVSGNGYPCYFKIIQNAIDDINNNFGNIDRLVISVDSEDKTKDDKYDEIFDFIKDKPCSAIICIVVQHFCLETWALGNREILRRKTTNQKVREYIGFYNVYLNDPELLPPYNEENRAQFAYRYLLELINDRDTSANFSKRRPDFLGETVYFTQIQRRLEETEHIKSFQAFLDAFTTETPVTIVHKDETGFISGI